MTNIQPPHPRSSVVIRPMNRKAYVRTIRPPLERFMEKVSPEPNTGCWLWTGCLDHTGYAVFVFEGRPQRASRAALVMLRGLNPAGLYACHHCDVRSCVNPDHLFLGTAKENMQDCKAKGRLAIPTHCKRGHEFTPENTRRDRDGWRSCLACAARRYAELKAARTA